jgi:hypothetical protein
MLFSITSDKVGSRALDLFALLGKWVARTNGITLCPGRVKAFIIVMDDLQGHF